MTSHVLVVRLDNDGDVLLTGPAIRAVAAGAQRVTMLCGPRGRRAAELLLGVDHLVTYRAEWIDLEPPTLDRQRTMRLVGLLGDLAVDEAIVFTSFHQSALPTALLLRLAGVRRVAAICDDYPGSLLDVRHRVADDIHEVERSLSLAAAAGYRLPPGDGGSLRVRRPQRGRCALSRLQPYVVVHPGASVPARAWAPERNAALVDALATQGRRVVVTGGPAETALTARVAGGPRPQVENLGGSTSLAELAEVVAGAEAIVVGNTGPAHLAAAVGTPVVSLYAPTVPEVRWRPWKVPHRLLHVDVPCAGCRARACPVSGHPCLGGVRVRDVLDAVDELAPRSPAQGGARRVRAAPQAPPEGGDQRVRAAPQAPPCGGD